MYITTNQSLNLKFYSVENNWEGLSLENNDSGGRGSPDIDQDSGFCNRCSGKGEPGGCGSCGLDSDPD